MNLWERVLQLTGAIVPDVACSLTLYITEVDMDCAKQYVDSQILMCRKRGAERRDSPAIFGLSVVPGLCALAVRLAVP